MNTITIHEIRSEQDYDFALAEMARLMQAEPNSDEEALLAAWGTAIEAYEDEHYPIPKPSDKTVSPTTDN